jgi:hypothetical protein
MRLGELEVIFECDPEASPEPQWIETEPEPQKEPQLVPVEK